MKRFPTFMLALAASIGLAGTTLAQHRPGR